MDILQAAVPHKYASTFFAARSGAQLQLLFKVVVVKYCKHKHISEPRFRIQFRYRVR